VDRRRRRRWRVDLGAVRVLHSRGD
jgi:hypothetical protein